VGTNAQGGPLALHLHHSTIHHLRISSLVALLSDGQCQGKIKWDTKTCMFRDNRANVHYSYGCYGGTRLPPLDLVVQGKTISAAHRLWSLGCWSYLHPSRGHSSILMRLQKVDPIFNMGVYVIRPALQVIGLIC
jgi:hypothetical protein